MMFVLLFLYWLKFLDCPLVLCLPHQLLQCMLCCICSGSVKYINFCLSLFTSQFDKDTYEGCCVLIDKQTGTGRNEKFRSRIGRSEMDSEIWRSITMYIIM
jgi:hypothetical protein